MSERRRWTPVRGYGNRVYEPWERWATLFADLPGRAWTHLRGHPARSAPAIGDGEPPARVLILRLDRIGDVVMSLSALAALRARLPKAHIALAVGEWSLEIARSAEVDEILVWNAPWVGRPREGRHGWRALLREAWAQRAHRIDVGLDLQGDPRASLLLWLAGACVRAGYANAGGEALLTHVVPLDETQPWPEQNLLALRRVLGDVAEAPLPRLVSEDERAAVRSLLGHAARPWIAIHPSGGREVKQWPIDRWCAVARGLVERFGGSILVTGSAADRALAAPIVAAVGDGRAVDLAGRASLRQTLAVLSLVDLFLSADTGPMHLAQALGTPSVAVFGPSDPLRYLTSRDAERHAVVRADLWCAPCNRIRRPPAPCRRGAPECLDRVAVEDVLVPATRLLSARRSM